MFAYRKLLAGPPIRAPFVGPKELERRRGRPYKARLGANECLFGVSPLAMRVMAESGREVAFYSDPTNRDLRDAIAVSWGQSLSRVVVAEGIEGLLGLFVRAFIEPGDVSITSLGAYPSFDFYVSGCEGRVVHVPYLPSCWNDVDQLAEGAERHRAKLLYLANPDNPSGTLLPPLQIQRLIERIPPTCVLLLDEAYAEFAGTELLPANMSWPNLVRLRTFSKLYGLAGARVGYALAESELVHALESIRQHFAVGKLSQEMALAAFHDHTFLADVLSQTDEGREEYCTLAGRIGATVLPSSANFVAFDFGTASLAKLMADYLEKRDVFVRRPSDPPLDRLIRVTVGPPEARAYLCEVLLEAMASLQPMVIK